MDTGNLALLMIIIVSLGLFVMVYGIVYLKSRERMAMIERGMEPQTSLPKQKQVNPAFSLTFGLLLIGSGLGLLIAFLMDQMAFSNANRYIDTTALYFALIAVFGGLGLFISYLLERKNEQKKDL